MGGAGYGALTGMAAQARIQLIGVSAVIAWSALLTLAILLAVKRLTGLRARDEEIEDGLDLSQHGERSTPN